MDRTGNPNLFYKFLLKICTRKKKYNIFVCGGTGSGKTECFMWPLLAKLMTEALEKTDNWEQRGVRTIIMYPMNALVSDQVSRLRKLIGDSEDKFIDIFRNSCGKNRWIRFKMNTSPCFFSSP